jgi:ketosteroid isomerase-like protein
MMRFPPILAASLTLLFVAACGGQYLNSPVLDDDARIRRSPESEAVAIVIEEYARALDAMDIDAIRSIVSTDYYENAGTTDTTTDDFGYAELTTMFATLLEHIEEMDIDIAIRDLVVEDDAADVLLVYTMRVRYTVTESAHWETERDVNRIQLRNEEGNWRIVSGL